LANLEERVANESRSRGSQSLILSRWNVWVVEE
jgi:hypothetical protein